MGEISENVDIIRQNIKAAAEKSGRKPEDVLLLGVTKTVGTERIRELADCGVTEFGENRVQELLEKYDIIDRDVKWHLIGRLQTNKVKYIIGKVKLIHSVDSLKLLQEIDKRAKAAGIVQDILIEVNVGEEASKGGVSYKEASDFADTAAEYSGIKVKGFMTVAPFVENPEDNREIFRKMRKLFVDNSKKINHNISMEYLSMGMTNDYQVAVEEGANIVRVGTGIFGKRDYTK